MPVDPFLQRLLESLPPLDLPADGDWVRWREEGRIASNELMGQVGEPGPEVKERRAVTVAARDGSIDLLVYVPEADEPLPIHVFLHGGGWIAGDIHSDFIDAACRERAAGASCVVVAVNYRKAPDHPFPTALDDCRVALRWVVDHADEIGGRADLITLGGQSAGANLAAALCLRLREEGASLPALQLLEVAALDLTLSSPSVDEFSTGFGLDRTSMEHCVRLYLGDDGDATDPLASPLLADDLSGLPRTHVMTSEFDPVRDDGARYVERLREAGVEATYTLGEGHIHGSSTFTKVMESARTWRTEALEVLRAAHRRHGA